MPFNSINRAQVINKLSDKQFDVLIVGGGITGAGIALDAVSRGFSVALVEKGDFASGTSSKSTKLIHGGLRYLKNLELKLVRDTGLERAVVFRNAPHLVRPEKMLLPLIEGGTYGKLATSFGLWLYDVLAWVRKVDRRKMIAKKRVHDLEPLLRKDKIKGAGYYSEYRTDDARLTIEILKSAANKGAVVINYSNVSEFDYEEGKINGVKVKDIIGENSFSIKTKYVINAAGPWVDKLREKDKSLTERHLLHTKGVHIVVPRNKFPLHQSVYFDVEDGRMIFAIPRQETTYIGTTDTFYRGDLNAPDVSKEDVKYLLSAVNMMFPSIHLAIRDIVSSWSGLRPLISEEGKDPSELSRTDELFESPSGLITIAGGKLTGYRLMAKKVVRLICDKEGVTRKCKTRRIKLTGAEFRRTRDVELYFNTVATLLDNVGVSPSKSHYMVTNYGTQSEEIINLFNEQKYQSLTCAEAHYTILNEGVCRLEDFFVRRTGKLFFDPSSIASEIDVVMNIFVALLNWSEAKQILEKKNMFLLLEKSKTFI